MTPTNFRHGALAVACALALTTAACGKGGGSAPAIGKSGSEKNAATDLGFPAFATKNTTRVGGADATADAAAVARAVYPGMTPGTRPSAVVLVDAREWRVPLAASVLASRPIRAPLLFSDGTSLPAASEDTLKALAPSGSEPAGGAQVIRVGDVAKPAGMHTTDIRATPDPFKLAREIDEFQSAARGHPSSRVIVVSANAPEYAMPAAAWAAKVGDPILFVTGTGVPRDTAAALRTHGRPRIYVLGPSSVIAPRVTKLLRRYGVVVRVGGRTAVDNAIAFARYADKSFGWGVVDPGHGLVFASQSRPLDAAAAAMLSASGTYGPLLLVDDAQNLPPAVERYLLDIEPGYQKDPTRGVYNHGWIIGSDKAISIAAQSRIDSLLEIVRVNPRGSPAK
jgi:hypothetical protein